jgi:enterochelin esterase family protein
VNPLLVRILAQRDPARFAKQHQLPLIDGDRVTFVYVGKANEVSLRHWIYGLPGRVPLQRLGEGNVWYADLELPERSRVEYKLEVDGHWILDPLNPRKAQDPFGANSVCYGPGYLRPDWARPDPGARKGTLDGIAIDSDAFGDRRELPIYLPARFRKSHRYPLLVVHDGNDYLDYSGLRVVLDNLIDRLEIPALIAVLSNPGDRLREYAADERHAAFLAEELVPAVDASFPTTRRAPDRCLMGASFGAVASLATAWQRPGVFGRLLLQSGSFAFTDIGQHSRGPEFDPVVAFVNAFRRAPGKPSERAFVSCGVHESLIYENRSMLPVLQKTGMDVRFVEAPDGHNWENWRDRLREGLSWLWPGPLWMTYE